MPVELSVKEIGKPFSLPAFECAFYSLLFKYPTLDKEGTRKFFYNGKTLSVNMVDSQISTIIDLSNNDKVLYSKGGIVYKM